MRFLKKKKNRRTEFQKPTIKTKDKATKIYTYEEGGGADTDGTPTEDDSLLVVEEETLANRSATAFHDSKQNREQSNTE